MASQTDMLRDALSGYTRGDITAIIDRLAGDKDNFRVDFKNVKFTVGGETFNINGFADFKVIHEIPYAHSIVKEVTEKYG